MKILKQGLGKKYQETEAKLNQVKRTAPWALLVTLIGVSFCLMNPQMNKIAWSLLWVAALAPMVWSQLNKSSWRDKLYSIRQEAIDGIKWQHLGFTLPDVEADRIFKITSTKVVGDDLEVEFAPTNLTYIKDKSFYGIDYWDGWIYFSVTLDAIFSLIGLARYPKIKKNAIRILTSNHGFTEASDKLSRNGVSYCIQSIVNGVVYLEQV